MSQCKKSFGKVKIDYNKVGQHAKSISMLSNSRNSALACSDKYHFQNNYGIFLKAVKSTTIKLY